MYEPVGSNAKGENIAVLTPEPRTFESNQIRR